MDISSKDPSVAMHCPNCSRTIALISVKNKPSDREGVKYNCDINAYLTICRSCETNENTVTDDVMSVMKKDIAHKDIVIKLSKCVSGHIKLLGDKRHALMMDRSTIFDSAPNRYRMVLVTGIYSYPTDPIIPSDFF